MKRGFVRIIAGRLRQSRLNFPNIKGLRPTPDRVRETLFNWLSPSIVGARCLDLFAGSGALGFEALSRGAQSVVFVDQSPEVIQSLKQESTRLKAMGAQFIEAALPNGLPQLVQGPFDIIFIDPPYHQHLLTPTCHVLEESAFLAPKAKVYLEAERVIEDNDLPASWRTIKAKRAGDVFYHLVEKKKD